MSYVYRVEGIARLMGLGEPVLRLERQFGPPHDYPHRMLETVRKQLPTTRAVYKLECLQLPPHAPTGWDRDGQARVMLRIPERNSLFAELTRIPDERGPDVRIADKWLPLTPGIIVALGRSNGHAQGAQPVRY